MEHWGLVTFRETALLYQEGISSTANKQRVATVIAHEVSLCNKKFYSCRTFPCVHGEHIVYIFDERERSLIIVEMVLPSK